MFFCLEKTHRSSLTTHSLRLLFHLHLQLGYDFAVEEVYDAVGIVGVALGVGYHDDGGAFFVELFEQVHHFHAVLGVEVTRWLVGKDNLVVGDDGTGNGDALLRSARELCGEVLCAVGHGHAFNDILHLLAAFLFGCAHIEQGQFHVFGYVQSRSG